MKTPCSHCGAALGEARLVVHSIDMVIPISGSFCLPKVGEERGCFTKALEAAK